MWANQENYKTGEVRICHNTISNATSKLRIILHLVLYCMDISAQISDLLHREDQVLFLTSLKALQAPLLHLISCSVIARPKSDKSDQIKALKTARIVSGFNRSMSTSCGT